MTRNRLASFRSRLKPTSDLGDDVVAEQILDRLDVVAGDAEQWDAVDLRVDHQFVGRVLGHFGAHFVPGATGLDDPLHGDRVVARRRRLESR
jgi:hypothetical protein